MNNIRKFIQTTSLQFRPLPIISENDTFLLSNYNLFLLSIRRMLHKKQFRKALTEIELNFHLYQSLSSHLPSLYILKSKCILKIINKKLKNHPSELLNDKSYQSFSLHFWFNQLFFTLEQLILSLRSFPSDPFIEPPFTIIEQVVQLHFDMLFHLAKYSFHTKQFAQLMSYFSMADNILYFYTYSKHPRTLNIIRRIYIMRANILIGNNDYDSSLKYQRMIMDNCFKELLLLVDVDEGLPNVNNNKVKHWKLFKECFIDLVIAFYLRGVSYEYLGSLEKAIEAYKQCRWFSSKFLMESEREFALFCLRIEKRAFIYYGMIKKIKKEINLRKEQQKRKDEIRKIYTNNEGHNGLSNVNGIFGKLRKVEFFKRIVKSEKLKDYSKLEKMLGNIQFRNIDEINGDDKKDKPKTNFIMSTVKIINTLLQRKFIDVVKGMHKIEITKLNEDNYDKIRKKLIELNQNEKADNHSHNNNNNISNEMKHSHSRMNRSCSSRNIQTKTVSKSLGTQNLRYINNKVEKLKYDNEIFSKSYVKKKTFLENYNNKEVDFLKKILILKKNEIENTIPDPSKMKKEAEQDFTVKLILAKSQDSSSSLNKLLIRSHSSIPFILSKRKNPNDNDTKNETLSIDEMKHLSKSYFTFRKNDEPDLSNSTIVSKLNNEMIKKLNKEYEELNYKGKRCDYKQKQRDKQYRKVITLNKKEMLLGKEFYYK